MGEYSETGAAAREKFRASLLQRDRTCIFREASLNQEVRLDMSLDGAADHVRGVHFIPHCRGDEVSLHNFLSLLYVDQKG